MKYPKIFEEVELEEFILNFYEIFIDAYNKSLKIDRGIFYTRFPIVNFILRGIDSILISSFKIKNGIINTSLKYLDPAAGTLTFLSQFVKMAKNRFQENKQIGLFEGWVRDHFLINVFAFEIMMAPYTLGHFKINMVLNDLGYVSGSNERVQSFLTNSLHTTLPTSVIQKTLFESIGLADEFKEADKIKRKEPILVIMGNPPYKKLSQNNSKWIAELMKDYRKFIPDKWKKTLQALNDDYVKFIRFAQWKIDQTKKGIIAYITNNTFLDGPIFSGMRRVIYNTFDEFYIINLHGSMRREIPDDIKQLGINIDESVFDITLGTCIFFFIKRNKKNSNEKEEDNTKGIKYYEIWGLREDKENPNNAMTKFGWLNNTNLSDINFINIHPKEPYYLFVPYEFEHEEEYKSFISLEDIFIKFQVGVTTARDSLVIGFTQDEVTNKLRLFANQEFSQLKRMGIKLKDYESAKWFYKNVSKKIDPNDLDDPIEYLYRGFDKRYVYYNKLVIHRMCENIMKHMEVPKNIALLTTKQLVQVPFNHAFITKNISDIIVLSTKTKENAMVFPLLLEPNRSNIKEGIIKKIREDYNVRNKSIDISKQIFNYVYAILHSNIYRETYAKGLAKDYPRIPFVYNKENFEILSKYGKDLIELHLLTSNDIDPTLYEISDGSGIIEKVDYHKDEEKIYINEEQYFGNITITMWNFKIGTIQQIYNWLSRRIGSQLNVNDFIYLLKVFDSINKTVKIVNEIDKIFQSEFT